MKGTCSREVELRDLTGYDEAFLMEECRSLLPAQWTTELLLRCLVSFDGRVPVTRDVVGALTVGDREALVLQVRRLYAGERVQCILSCPAQDCGENLDLDLRIADLLVSVGAEPKEWHEVWIRERDIPYRVRFRVPTGSDQEAAAALARTDLRAATDLLLERCVDSVVSIDDKPVKRLSALLQEQLAAAMAELDAQAELTLRVICPACGCSFVTIFDAASYLFHEMQARTPHLYHELHLLAYHYHWSPSEILGMSARGRKRYLQLLQEELGSTTG